MTEEDFGWGKKAAPAGYLDDFEGVIEAAVFQEGEYGVQLTLSIKNIDPDYTGENQNAWYSLGTGDFVVLDGGLRIGGGQFKENSKLDLLVKATLKVGAKLPPGDMASVWEGMTFHWKRMTMTSLAGRSIKIADREPEMLTPTKYLGKREIEAAAPESAALDVSIAGAFKEALKEAKEGARGPMKWPALMLKVMSKHPEMKAQVALRGRTILSGLVTKSVVAEEVDGYTLAMDF